MLKLLYEVAQTDSYDSSQAKDKWGENSRRVALNTILDHYPTHPKTLELLRDRAANDPDEQLREWAQEQLKVQNVKLKMKESSDG